MKKYFLYSLILLAPLLNARAWPGGEKSVDVSSFGARCDGSDSTPAVRAAIAAIKTGNIHKLEFAPGRYDFWPDQAEEKCLFICNNDDGLKHIIFPLEGIKQLVIDGHGASFVFHGQMVPFLIDHSQDITITNLSFDFSRPFQSEGRVLAVTSNSVDLKFSGEFPYAIRNGVLVFTGGNKLDGPETTVNSGEVLYPYGNLLAFDPQKHETAFMAQDFYGVDAGVVAQAIGEHQVRVWLNQVSAKPGDILVFGPKYRDYPGVVISDSQDVHLSKMNIFNADGMGVIAQFSANLFLDYVNVTPPPGGKRIVSVTADATHFVNCRGKIVMANCLFEQQMDDACNIHGIYAQISRISDATHFEVHLMHPEQAGACFVKAGTHLELTRATSMETLGYTTVRSADWLNKEYALVTVSEPLPPGLHPGDCVADSDANTADVLVTNCIIRGNRARGLLLGSRGKVLVVNNTFHVPGAAILFEGDARFWFEQAGVRDAVIRGNTFDDCNYGVWGNACIQVGADITEENRATCRYNKNILIEGNLFRVFSSLPLLSIYSVDGLTFTNNREEQTDDYPSSGADPHVLFNITDSDHVNVLEPTVISQKSSKTAAVIF